MHLIEVVMAGSVFAIASSSSMQLWSATAVRAHQLSTREQLEQQIEQDRLQLQTLWRNSLQSQTQMQSQSQNQGTQADQGATQATGATTPTGCAATAAQLFTLASSQPALPSLRRALQLSPDGQALQIHWNATGDPSVKRDRVVTPAGLGLCGMAPVSTSSATLPAVPLPETAEHGAQEQATPAPASNTPLTDSQVEGVPS